VVFQYLEVMLLGTISQDLSHAGQTTFGAYLLFNFALNFKNNILTKVGTKVDLYMVYICMHGLYKI
jgi:hypothetical protein